MAVSMTFDSLLEDLRQYLERGTDITDSTVYNQLPMLIDLGERNICRRLKIQGFIKARTSAFLAGNSVVAKPNRWRQTVSINFGQPSTSWSVTSRASAGTARTVSLDRPHGLVVGQNVVVAGVGTGYDGQFTLTGVGFTSISYTGSTMITENVVTTGYVAASGTFTYRTPLLARGYEIVRAFWPDESQRGVPRYYADYTYSHWLIAPTPRMPYPFEVNSYELPEQLDSSQQTNFLTQFCPEALLYASLAEAEPFLKEDSRIQIWKGKLDEILGAISGEDMGKIMDRASKRGSA